VTNGQTDGQTGGVQRLTRPARVGGPDNKDGFES